MSAGRGRHFRSRTARGGASQATLAGLALLGVVAGLVYRWGHGLTGDEPFTANHLRLPWTALWSHFPVDNVPLHYTVLKIWSGVAGESELALRSLSAVAFGAAVWWTGTAAARIAGRAGGIAAALLLIASDRVALEQAATARAYAMVAALAAAAMAQSVRLLDRDDPPTGRTLGAVLLLSGTHLAAMLTHPAYGAVAAACTVAAILADRRLSSPLVLAPVLGLAAYVVLWGPIASATIDLGTTAWMRPPTWAEVRYSFFLQWGAGPTFLMAGALIAVLLRDDSATVRTLTHPAVFWLGASAGGGWLFTLLISEWQPIFKPAHTPVLLLPMSCAFVASLLARLGGSRLVVTLALGLLAVGAYRAILTPRADVYQTRSSFEGLVAQARCGDAVVAPGLAAWVAEYYLRRLGAATCVHLVPFPAGIAAWTGRWDDAVERARLEAEADAIASARAGAAGATWVLTLSRPDIARDASIVIAGALRSRLRCDAPAAADGAFFDAVTRCLPARDAPQ